MRNKWRLFAREVGEVVAVGVVVVGAIQEDRGTAGGSTACLQLTTIRIAIALTLLITSSAIISQTIAIIRINISTTIIPATPSAFSNIRITRPVITRLPA